MKVKDLKRILEYANEDEEVVVVVKTAGSVAGLPFTKVKTAGSGIDWDSGKFQLFTEDLVKKTSTDEIKAAQKALDDAGWSLYEMRNLKAEVKKLRDKLKECENAK